MSENIESTDKPVKKAPAKKAAAKKAPAKTKVTEDNVDVVVNKNDGEYTVIVFDSGTAYISGDYHFTRENRIRQVPSADAARFLELDNFRLADQIEIEEYLASRED